VESDKSGKAAKDSKHAMSYITHQQYNSGVHKLRQLYFTESSCSEDNDTDDDDIAEFAYRAEKFKIENKGIFKGNIKIPLSKSLLKYWELYEEPKMKGRTQKIA
jgi:hypothetical protein